MVNFEMRLNQTRACLKTVWIFFITGDDLRNIVRVHHRASILKAFLLLYLGVE